MRLGKRIPLPCWIGTMSSGHSHETSSRQAGRQMRQVQSNMPSFVELTVFLIIAAIGVGLAINVGQSRPGLGIAIAVASVIFAALVGASIKVANQWERGIVLRLGEFQSIRGPGLFFVLPIIDRVR